MPMPRLVIFILIIGFVSPVLCLETNTFNVMDYGACGNGTCDDSNAILSAWDHACGAKDHATLLIPGSKTFLVTRLELNGPCQTSSISIKIAGKIVAPPRDRWTDDKSNWIMMSYVNDLTVEGSSRGINIDGHGSTWWPHKCRSCNKPAALRFYFCNNLLVNNLTVVNSPKAHISVCGCKGVRFTHMNINAPRHSPNTDGFDISASKDVVIQDSKIGTGDDCIAINGGSSSIHVTRVICGPGHGISIGSLGKHNSREIVEDVQVRNCVFKGTTNGARIKTWPGGSGHARNIIFENIELKQARHPIIIDQSYGGKRLHSTDNAVKVSNVSYIRFNGTAIGRNAIDLKCSALGCFNVTLDQIHIESPRQKKSTYASCKNVHGRVGYNVPEISCIMD